MSPVTVRVPGKVNLQLSVGGLQPDGYHDLVTVFQAVSLYDDVRAAWAPNLTVSVQGVSSQSLPCDETNLAARAAGRLAARLGIEPEVHLHIVKRIPVAGGMAGGSADAAAALVACDALWGLRMERQELLEVAAEIGSDVPFALLGGTAVGVGRGERLTPALARGDFHWVLAFAQGGLATPAVYRELDRLRRGGACDVPAPQVSAALMAALRAGDPVPLGRSLHNDMQRAACRLRPQLRFTLDVGEEYGALGAVVSGSGPTCAFLARDQEHALDLAVALSAAGVCRSVKHVHGPVHGARVVSPEDVRR